MNILVDQADPVRRSIESFPGGPQWLWILLGLPMLLVSIWAIWTAVSIALGQDARRRKDSGGRK
ncbi:MAG: hypothetical protein R3336_07955 [Phycisphaeraceae bacterium]|nr:hypothetical protein [Phycisphaeraceae bacterium]